MNSQTIKYNLADYFTEYVKLVPLSLSFIRALECAMISQHELKRPCLDIGCGDGQFAKVLFREKLDVGLDISKKDLFLCKKQNMYRSLVLANAHFMGLRSNYFSTVFSNCVFEHIANIEHFLGEIHRVLKKDGVLIFTTHTPLYERYLMQPDPIFKSSELMRRLGFFYSKTLNQIWLHTSIFPRGKWSRLLKENGFEIVEYKYYMSKASTRIFNSFLRLAIPPFLIKKITSKWLVFNGLGARRALIKHMSRYFQVETNTSNLSGGACILFKVRKV